MHLVLWSYSGWSTCDALRKKARATVELWEEMAGRGDIKSENTLAEILAFKLTWSKDDTCVCLEDKYGTRKSLAYTYNSKTRLL